MFVSFMLLLVCLLSFAKSYSKRDRFNQLTNSQQTIYKLNMQIKYYNIIICIELLDACCIHGGIICEYANAYNI